MNQPIQMSLLSDKPAMPLRQNRRTWTHHLWGVFSMVLILWIGQPAQAQTVLPTVDPNLDMANIDYGEWAFYDHNEQVRFRLPNTWQAVTQEAGYTLYESEDRGVRMDFSSTRLDADISILTLLEDVASTFTGDYVLEDAALVDTYIGTIGRIEVSAVVNGNRLRLLQYLLLDGRDFVLVQALTRDDAPEVNDRRVVLFDLVIGSASYLNPVAADSTWRTYQNTDAIIQMSAPANWDLIESAPNYLTVTLRELGVTVTVNYQPLTLPYTSILDMTGILLATYRTQELPIQTLEPVRLPVGNGLLARIEDWDVTRNDGAVIRLTQHQYAILRGRWLIFVTLGARSELFTEALPLMRRILATLAVIGDTSIPDA